MDDCVKFEGALEKTSGIFKNKSKIWLVLDNRSLNFYKNKMKDSCIDSIEIADVQIVRQTGKKGGDEFEISTAHKSYTFVAAAFELAEAWVKVIHKAMSIRCIPSIDDDTSNVPKSPSTPISSPSSVFEEINELSSQPHNSIFGVKLKPTRLSRSSVTSPTSPERISVRQFSYEPSGFNENSDTTNKKTIEQDRKAKIVPPMPFKLQRPPPSFKPPPPPISKSGNTNMNQTEHSPKENITIRSQLTSHRDEAIMPRKSQNEGYNIIVSSKSPPPGDSMSMKLHSPRPTDDASNSPVPNENTTFIEQTSHEDNARIATQEGHVLEAVDTPIITDTSKLPVDKKTESVEDATNSANTRGNGEDLQEADSLIYNKSDADISEVRMRKSQTISQNVECNDVDANILHVVMRKSARSRSTMNTEWDKDTDGESVDCSEVMKMGTKDIRGENEVDSTNVNYEEGKSQLMSSSGRSTSNNHHSFRTENDTSSSVYTDSDIIDDDIPAPAYETKYLRHDSNVNEDDGDNECLFNEEVFESMFAIEKDKDSPLQPRNEDRLHIKCDAFNKLKQYIDTQCEGGFDIVLHRLSMKRPVEVLRNVLFVHMK